MDDSYVTKVERETVMSLYETISFELMDAQEWDMTKYIVKDLMVQRRKVPKS